MEFDFDYNPYREELAEIKGKQELYSSLYAADLKRFPEPKQYPLEAIPEEDVRLLQMRAVGALLKERGNQKDVKNRIQEMKRLGVDLARRPGDLTPMECAFVNLYQNGVTEPQDMATELKIPKIAVNRLKSQVEEKLDTTYEPISRMVVVSPKPIKNPSTPWRTELPASMLEYSEAVYRNLEKSRNRKPVELSVYQETMAAAGGA